jgi:class 3 adenylate cyclase
MCEQCAASNKLPPQLTLAISGSEAAPCAAPRLTAQIRSSVSANNKAEPGERKEVSILFADIKGSMELIAERDPEEAQSILDPALALMIEAVHHYDGTVCQVMGDGIMALFGAPLALEDHAVRACHAALHLQRMIENYATDLRGRLGVDVQVRVGLNSGEAVVRGIVTDVRHEYTAVGQTAHLAARMEQLARPGTTLMAQSTATAVGRLFESRPLGPVPVKGLTEPVHVFELLSARRISTHSGVAAAKPGGLSSFVGRDAEMLQIAKALDRVAEGRGQVIALVGEPGIGKSRLAYEVIRSGTPWAGWRLRAGRSPTELRPPSCPSRRFCAPSLISRTPIVSGMFATRSSRGSPCLAMATQTCSPPFFGCWTSSSKIRKVLRGLNWIRPFVGKERSMRLSAWCSS